MGLGFGVCRLGFGVWGLGVWGFGGLGVWGFGGLGVWGFGGLGFRVCLGFIGFGVGGHIYIYIDADLESRRSTEAKRLMC